MHFTTARRLGVALFVSTLLHAVCFLVVVWASTEIHHFPATALAPLLHARLPGEIIAPQREEAVTPLEEKQAATEAVPENSGDKHPAPPEATQTGKALPEKSLRIPLANPAWCGGAVPVYSYEETESRPYFLRGILPQADAASENFPTGRIVLQVCIAEDGRVWNAILIDSELPQELSEKFRQAYLDALFSPGKIAQKPVRTAIIIVGDIE